MTDSMLTSNTEEQSTTDEYSKGLLSSLQVILGDNASLEVRAETLKRLFDEWEVESELRDPIFEMLEETDFDLGFDVMMLYFAIMAECCSRATETSLMMPMPFLNPATKRLAMRPVTVGIIIGEPIDPPLGSNEEELLHPPKRLH